MNRVMVTRLQHLYFELLLSRSSRTYIVATPMERMLGNPLLQRRSHSCCGVSLCGVNEATISHSGNSFVVRSQVYLSRSQYPRGAPTVRNAYTNGNNSSLRYGNRRKAYGQVIQNTTSDSEEIWGLWQLKNCSVEDIMRNRRLERDDVYKNICDCLLRGKGIDWYEFSQEAGFTQTIVLDINRAKAEAALAQQLGEQVDDLGHIPVQCGYHVTDVHILLYNTMMACGIVPETLFDPIQERISQQPDRVTSLQEAPAPPKAHTRAKRAAAVHETPAESKITDRKDTSHNRAPTTEEADTKKALKRLTQKHMLQWISDKDGVSLIELALEYKDYNECQLMRLILLLERKKLIYLSRGLFRVSSVDDESRL